MNTLLEYKLLAGGTQNTVDPYRALADQIRAIGRITMAGVRMVGKSAQWVGRFVVKQWNEGAELHNRAIALQDERYRNNYYHLRQL